MKTIKYFLIIIFLTGISFAQSGGSFNLTNPRATAMGNSSAASSRGIYSLGLNPANLAIPQDHTVELSLLFPIPNINFQAGNDFITINDYNYFFGGVDVNGVKKGRLLTDSDKQKFINLFSNGSSIRTGFSIPIFSLSVYAGKEIGAFGLSLADRLNLKLSLPVELFKLGLYGNEVGKTYNLEDFKFEASYLRSYGFTYSREITGVFGNTFKLFTIGASVKMVQGFAYATFDHVNAQIQTLNDHSILLTNDSQINIAVSPDFGINWDFDNQSRNSNISPFMTPAGKGIGFDFGLNARLDDVWSFAIAVTDIGKINWDAEIVNYTSKGVFTFAKIDSSTLDSLGNTFKGKGAYGKAFSTKLPTVLRIGATFRLDKMFEGDFPGTMLIVANMNKGFNDEQINSTKARFSFGFEWRPINWLPIRSGISFGGVEPFNWSFGFGFNTAILDIDFATYSFNSILSGNNAKNIGVSIGSRWKF